MTTSPQIALKEKCRELKQKLSESTAFFRDWHVGISVIPVETGLETIIQIQGSIQINGDNLRASLTFGKSFFEDAEIELLARLVISGFADELKTKILLGESPVYAEMLR